MAEPPIWPLRTTERLTGRMLKKSLFLPPRPWARRDAPFSDTAFSHRSDPQRTTKVRFGPSRAAALLDSLFERLHTSDDLTLPNSRSQYLKNETFQVPRFRHGGKDGMVPGLSTLFKQAELPLRISCSQADTRPQFLFSHVVGAGTRGQKSLRLGESYPKQIHIFVSSQSTGHGLLTTGK